MGKTQKTNSSLFMASYEPQTVHKPPGKNEPISSCLGEQKLLPLPPLLPTSPFPLPLLPSYLSCHVFHCLPSTNNIVSEMVAWLPFHETSLLSLRMNMPFLEDGADGGGREGGGRTK